LVVDFALTSSWYGPASDGAAWGRCDACVVRSRGVAEAGVADPTRYRAGWSLARELLAVAHGRPHVRLHVGQGLADVVAVVVDPLLEQIPDPQEADLGVLAAAIEIGLAQAAHERRALPPQPRQLVEERRDRPLAVAPRAGDLG